MELKSINQSGNGGVWEFLGHDINNKYWARVYSIDNKYNDNIHEFRMAFYKKIIELVQEKYNDKIIKTGEYIESKDPKNDKDKTRFDYYENGRGRVN